MSLNFFSKNKDVDFSQMKKPAIMLGITVAAIFILPAIIKFTSLFIFTLLASVTVLTALAFTKPMTFLSTVKAMAS